MACLALYLLPADHRSSLRQSLCEPVITIFSPYIWPRVAHCFRFSQRLELHVVCSCLWIRLDSGQLSGCFWSPETLPVIPSQNINPSFVANQPINQRQPSSLRLDGKTASAGFGHGPLDPACFLHQEKGNTEKFLSPHCLFRSPSF